MRRFLRIMPAYWLAFLVTNYVMHIDTNVHPGWHSLLIYLGLVQLYFPSHALTGLTQAWSLCTEIAFYLFLPLYAVVVVRGRRSDRHQLARELMAWRDSSGWVWACASGCCTCTRPSPT